MDEYNNITVDVALWSKSADWRGRNIWASRTSLVSSSAAMCCTIAPRWWVTEMIGFHNFYPHPVQHLGTAIMSLSPIILYLHLAKKNFQTCIPSAHESVSVGPRSRAIRFHTGISRAIHHAQFCPAQLHSAQSAYPDWRQSNKHWNGVDMSGNFWRAVGRAGVGGSCPPADPGRTSCSSPQREVRPRAESCRSVCGCASCRSTMTTVRWQPLSTSVASATTSLNVTNSSLDNNVAATRTCVQNYYCYVDTFALFR